MSMKMSEIEGLGKDFDLQMKRIVGASKTNVTELGTIGSDGSLTVPSLGNAIPKGDYMISLHLTAPWALGLNTSTVGLTTKTAEDHSHSIDGHKHTVTLPNRLRGLQAGDRVIVAWVGTEPVVIDIVVSS